MSPEPKLIYLVVVEGSGLFGCYFDRERAHNTARSVEGVVVELPITADFRAAEEISPTHDEGQTP